MNKPVKFVVGDDVALVAGNAVIVACPPPATEPANFSPPEFVLIYTFAFPAPAGVAGIVDDHGEAVAREPSGNGRSNTA